jgi:hypothetical protein
LGAPLPDGYRYSSDDNPRWLSMEEIQAIVQPIEAETLQGMLSA